MNKVIVRTRSAGVFYGELHEPKAETVNLTNARRLWYWSGAASLSELAVKGVSKPEACKFPVAVSMIFLTEVIEILETTEAAQKSIESVQIWTSHEKS